MVLGPSLPLDARTFERANRLGLLANAGAEYLDDLGYHPQLLLVRTRQHDGLEVRIRGPQRDLRVAPGFSLVRLLALVTFHGVALTGGGICGVPQLHEHGLPEPRAFHRRSKETVRPVRNRRL